MLCGGYELRRPISLCGFDAGLGLLRLVFEVRGKGTRWLSQRQAGEELDLVGPLGHGFPLMDRNSRAVLVGGGIGTPPLLPLAQRYGSLAPQPSLAFAAVQPPFCRTIWRERGRIAVCVRTTAPPASTASPLRCWSSV